jgi:hypothetical protein
MVYPHTAPAWQYDPRREFMKLISRADHREEQCGAVVVVDLIHVPLHGALC